ncbi:MAG: preprotein translocase subunit SecA [Parcubacteria group bacterium Gr01-1014_73]|nr:MAG: preprotein translocase subunit SecA [Parcubacteria group bacterium Gr01-1014_73]
MSIFSKIFGDENEKIIKAIQPLVLKINALEPEFEKLSAADLRAKTAEFKKRLAPPTGGVGGETLDDILPEAFAAVRESAKRTLGQRHFDVQLTGGVILHRGGIAEMKTGEGKTLVATLPVYLNALESQGIHIVTVNDYLSRRDAVWMGQIYHFLGLTVGVINHELSFLYDPTHTEADKTRDELGSFKVVHEFLRPVTRREAYQADITYGTNNEFGFDYLRDNLEYEPSVLRQRDYHFAIVDEIDSILIDEARTPLIISAPTSESEDLYRKFAAIARTLIKEKDFTVDEKFRSIAMTQEGIDRVEKSLNVGNIYTEGGMKFVHHLETAVRAEALFHKDKEYVVKTGEIIIVDEFTGRLQPGRRWSEGLHQAIEAKEGVQVQKESRTFASITFQNYFRLYKKLSGMTGTAATSKEEFSKVYGLNVTSIPTNQLMIRRDLNDVIFKTEHGKFTALARRIKELNKKGQPVLVGTVSIEKNEVLSQYLQRAGVKHEILNAKNHEREGEIIAQAGRQGAVTIATNMAGRGVDIKLGGNPASPNETKAVREASGLAVLGTERHEARRIDNQLRGRSGRQGDPGETQFFVSLEDNLMRIFAVDTIKKVMGFLKVAEDEPIENGLITKSLETAQTKIEGFNFDARKHVLEYDDVLNHQRKTIYDRRRKILTGGSEAVDEYLENLVTWELNSQVEGKGLEKAITEKRNALGENFYLVLKRVILQTIDMFWVEHLELMDYTRSSVNLRAYGQRDPLVEYKREGLRLFKEMEEAARTQIARLIPNLAAGAAGQISAEQKNLREVERKAQEIGSTSSPQAVFKVGDKKSVGRNDPCWCGSGKKFKKCHGKN